MPSLYLSVLYENSNFQKVTIHQTEPPSLSSLLLPSPPHFPPALLTMSTPADNKNEEPALCANCGQEEHDDIKLKRCAACKIVKYCGRDCQTSHRPHHKKACRKRAAALHEEALYRLPPRREDCSICFLMLPEGESGGGQAYMTCYGKMICSGCCYAHEIQSNWGSTCPFCRSPTPKTREEVLKRLNTRMKANDANAFFSHGTQCLRGDELLEVPQDPGKGLQLLLRGGKLGSASSYYQLACSYHNGYGLEKDEKKARHFDELAAIGGNVSSRHNLGVHERISGNMDKAIKHYKSIIR